jgi:hypothetical protein
MNFQATSSHGVKLRLPAIKGALFAGLKIGVTKETPKSYRQGTNLG